MAYLNTHARTTSATKNDSFQPMGRTTTLYGVFVGFIKDAADVQRNGRLRVWIPEFGSPPDIEDGWTIVNYCSPFAGATNIDSASATDVQSFEQTQTSYGMWMIPPDINNQVLVMFINGDSSRGIWIGSLYNQFMNNMVPAVAASASNYQHPGKKIPVAEYNKHDSKVTLPDRAVKPYNATKFNGVGNQGLITDTHRGVTDSSARREAPSQVFGILTPGPAIKKDVNADKIRRKGGSSFIMDDADNSEYIQFSTKSGAQVNINETTGFIYLINRDGTSWVQMDKDGNVDIFGARNISMRAQRDVNIRADRNINIEAGQNIFMKAAKDTSEHTTTFTYDVNNVPNPATIPTWDYVGEGKGQGGNIVMQALNNLQGTIQKGVFLSVLENNMDVSVNNTLNVTTKNGGQNYNSKQGIKLTTDASVDIAASGNIRVGANGSISVVGVNDVTVCTSTNINLKAADTILQAAANDILLTSTNLGVTAETLFSNTVGIGGAVNIGSNVDITGALTVGSTIDMGGNLAIGGITLPSPHPPAPAPEAPTEANPPAAERALSASIARPAEVKPLNTKLNVLATWADATPNGKWTVFSESVRYEKGDVVKYNNQQGTAEYYSAKVSQGPGPFIVENWKLVSLSSGTKFKRNSQTILTTVSGFPTFEPCPEHSMFKSASVAGATPIISEDDKTYSGSGSSGNGATTPPPAATSPGANNTSIQGDSPVDSNISKDVNINALRCQLIIHEGLKNKSYADTLGLLTGGIGHLLRSNEIPQYPLGTPISAEQIETWYIQDSASAIKIAQSLVPDVWDELSDIRKRAMIDLSYNMGKPRLSKFVNFLAAMKAKNFEAAGRALKESVWFNQVGRRGPNIITMIVSGVDVLGCDRKFPA